MALSYKEKLKKLWNDRFFWISVAIAIPLTGVTVIGTTYPDLLFLQIPFTAMMIGTMPAMASMVLAPRMARIFIWMHKNVLNFSNRSHITYTINEQYYEKPSYRNYALYNIWYAVGITFFILSLLPVNLSNINQLMAVTVGFVILAINFSSGINFAIFLINKKGIFYENKKDGSIINLGSELKKIINSSLFSFQILLFLYTLFLEKTLIPLLISLGFSLLICFIASLTSYFLLKKHYIDKIYLKFNEKLHL